MILVLIAGLFLLLVSLGLIIKPGIVVKLNRVSNKVIFTDSSLFERPVISGVLFLASGILILWSGLNAGMLTIAAIGLPGIIMGLLFIVRPSLIIKFNMVGNKVLFHDNSLLVNPRITGFLMLPVSIYIIYICI